MNFILNYVDSEKLLKFLEEKNNDHQFDEHIKETQKLLEEIEELKKEIEKLKQLL